ncbi:MAG: glucose 1-dehydrogenase [Sphingobium sp.]
MAGRLDGRIALLTGAASGMGAAQARLFIAEGARVLLTDIQEGGAALAEELGPDAAFCLHDVTRQADWEKAVALAESRFGGLDILVNNAGLFRPGAIEDTGVDLFDRHVAINQRGVFLGMRAVVPAMQRAGAGAIVNISSGAGLRGAAGMFAYATTKWAVRGMTKCAALDLAPYRIRVNSIHPGPIDTPMIGDWPPEWHERATESVPLKRLGQPDEIARLALFLASADADYMTGAEVAIDGGVTA